jgi:AsmA protein
MRRLVLALGVALCLCIFAGIGAYIVLQPGFLAPALADLVKARTGKTVTFAGTPQLTLWPEPVVAYPEVSLGEGEARLMMIGEARLTTTFSALFAKRVEIVRVHLVEPHLNLRIAAGGEPNWNLGEAPGPAITFSAEGGSLAYLDDRSGQRFAADEIRASGVFGESGPSLSGKGALVWNRQAVGFDLSLKSLARFAADGSPVSIEIEAPSGEFGFEGRAAVARGFGLAGQATLAAPDLRAFLRWIGMPFAGTRGFKDFRLAAALDAAPGSAAFKDALIEIDGMTATGGVAVTQAKNGPSFEGALAFERFDAAPYAAPLVAAFAKTEPLDLAGLSGYAARFSISAKSAALAGFDAGPLSFDVSVLNGKFEAMLRPAAAFGGTASASVSIDGAAETPSVKFAADGAGIDSEPLMGWLGGRADFTVGVSAEGKSIDEWVSRLSGTARIAARDGAIPGIDAAALLRRAGEAIGEGWAASPGAATPFSSLQASFTISDGIARTGDAVLEGQSLRIAAEGEIDLLRRAIDFKARPALDGAAPPVAVVVSGPWAAPSIYPDMPGILENPESAYRALKMLMLQGAQ